ncbi:MAG: phytanoyl-CoA dioxygenase family protein [Cyanobacteria bacterium J06632_3]
MGAAVSSVVESFSTQEIGQFQRQGYLIVNNVLTPELVEWVISRFDPLFNTQFETGIYPDEWYGRPGLSQPNATQQMTGLWRCDRALASLTLSKRIARLNATLMGWFTARYGLDTCWIKPPQAPAVSFHCNNTYAATLDPPEIITCWIALSHAEEGVGSLEIVPGSHQWTTADTIRFLHAPQEDYRTPLWQAAESIGKNKTDPIVIKLPPGSAVFLHGGLWHGSAPNVSKTLTRRSLSVSTLSGQTQFQPEGKGYIFERYRMRGSLKLDESYYPILWSADGYRTPFLEEYCRDIAVS